MKRVAEVRANPEGRPQTRAEFLADPDFVNKAAAGRADEINTCIACNQACLDFIFSDRVAVQRVTDTAERDKLKEEVKRRILELQGKQKSP